MCTLSIISPAAGTFVLSFNRDEQPHRSESGPAIAHGSPQTVMPTDLRSGGSWIAANAAGLAFAILNRNEPGLPSGGDVGMSRASIVPALAGATSIEHAMEMLDGACRGVERGFRLIVSDGARVLEAVGGGGSGTGALATCEPLVRPFVRTSSGLGDAVVRAPRTELFEATVARLPRELLESAQRNFHMHRWSDRRELSVLMDRREARTLSHTAIRIDPRGVEFSHRHRDGDGFTPWTALRLERA